MPRNRHASKKTSIQVPVNPIDPKQASKRINPAIKQNSQDQIIQILIDSASLASEPEFLDMEFDRQKAINVSTRHLQKSKKRFETAQMKGPDAVRSASDDVQIEIIDQLITPAFRTEFQKRLQSLSARLQPENDLKKLKMVMVLETGLKSNAFPISVIGLVQKIYNRTIQESLQDYEEEKVLLDHMKIDFNLFKSAPDAAHRAASLAAAG